MIAAIFIGPDGVQNKATNPYRAPRSIDLEHEVDDEPETLTFHGTIDAHDYARLLPRRGFDSLLYGLLTTMLGLVSLLLSAAVIFGLIRRGWNPVVVPATMIATLASFGTVFVLWFRRPIRRARRISRSFPDLFGSVDGDLSPAGLRFNDGDRHHYFLPEALTDLSVSDAGIRVRVDQDPRRFLALTSDLFDNFTKRSASKLIRAWRRHAVDGQQTAKQTLVEERCQDADPLSKDAIWFEGDITINRSLRTPQYRRVVAGESIVAVAALALAAFGAETFGSWGVYGWLGLVALMLVSNLRNWWRYFRASEALSWKQFGWVGLQEIVVFINDRGTRIPFNQIEQYADHGEMLVLEPLSGGAYYIARDHLANEEDWVTLSNRIVQPFNVDD